MNEVRVGVMVKCETCRNTKKPRGRSAPLDNSLCDSECPGYNLAPHVGSLWPGETSEDFGYPVGTAGSVPL